MEHNRAVEIQAVERYMLGEMPPEEREDFEEHYFTCAECARDMRAAARFRANARELLRNPEQFSPPVAERRNAWWRLPTMVPLTAAFALLGVVGYQNLVTLPALQLPQFPSTLALDGLTRGSLRNLDEGMPVDLEMAPQEPAEGQSMTVELAAESGKVMTKSNAPVPEHGKSLHVSFPGKYRPGRYTVYVREVPSGKVLFQDHFEIEPKESKANER
jgi:anti-sigma factor RsiW